VNQTILQDTLSKLRKVNPNASPEAVRGWQEGIEAAMGLKAGDLVKDLFPSAAAAIAAVREVPKEEKAFRRVRGGIMERVAWKKDEPDRYYLIAPGEYFPIPGRSLDEAVEALPKARQVAAESQWQKFVAGRSLRDVALASLEEFWKDYNSDTSASMSSQTMATVLLASYHGLKTPHFPLSAPMENLIPELEAQGLIHRKAEKLKLCSVKMTEMFGPTYSEVHPETPEPSLDLLFSHNQGGRTPNCRMELRYLPDAPQFAVDLSSGTELLTRLSEQAAEKGFWLMGQESPFSAINSIHLQGSTITWALRQQGKIYRVKADIATVNATLGKLIQNTLRAAPYLMLKADPNARIATWLKDHPGPLTAIALFEGFSSCQNFSTRIYQTGKANGDCIEIKTRTGFDYSRRFEMDEVFTVSIREKLPNREIEIIPICFWNTRDRNERGIPHTCTRLPVHNIHAWSEPDPEALPAESEKD
jgi:hypothetical protein